MLFFKSIFTACVLLIFPGLECGLLWALHVFYRRTHTLIPLCGSNFWESWAAERKAVEILHFYVTSSNLVQLSLNRCCVFWWLPSRAFKWIFLFFFSIACTSYSLEAWEMKASGGFAFFKVKSYNLWSNYDSYSKCEMSPEFCNDVISYHKLKPITAVVNVSWNRCSKLTVLQDFQWIM